MHHRSKHQKNQPNIGGPSKRHIIIAGFSVLLVGLFVFIRLVPILVPHSSADNSIVLYGDELNLNGWLDWSYDIDTQNVNTPFTEGNGSLEITYNEGWSAFYLSAYQPYELTEVDQLSVWLHGGVTGNQEIFIKVVDSSDTWRFVTSATLEANTWQKVAVDLTTVPNLDKMGGVVIQNGSANPVGPIYIDELILFREGGVEPSPTPTASTGPDNEVDYQLTIDTFTVQHTISDYVYGVNLADYTMGDELNLPVNRYGGNSTSRYNWKNSSTNLGHDWYFMGQARGEDNGQLPHGSATDLFVEQNRSTGTDTLLTVPMMGYVSKSREITCGFSVEKYGEQQDAEHWHPDCGNGRLADVTDGEGRIEWSDPLDTSIPVDETFVQEWITHLNGKYGAGDNGGVQFYSLDNEPMLWFYNHQDVHPEPVSYDEIRDKTYQYAPAIKAIDPTAQTIGPAVWGWHAYFSSAVDQESPDGYVDRQAHGDTPFLEWYLQEMAAYEAEHGTRILDYLDLHYYPQADGVTLSPVGDEGTMQRRLDSTRTLWDSTYQDKSWIPEPIYLVPRMHDWVDGNYPGTKLSISEYNFGGLEHINGAVTQADVLGIFGREDLHMAMLWGWLNIDASEPWAYAFRMYRNYDGLKSTFGDESLLAISSNEWDVSTFAARRSLDGAITIMVVNKTFESATTSLELQNLVRSNGAEVYQYSDEDLNSIRFLGVRSTENGTFTIDLPPQSMTLLVIKDPLVTEPAPTPTAEPSATPTSVPIVPIEDGDEIPEETPTPSPNLPSPREPDYQWELDQERNEAIDLGWLEVAIPAETFAEDFYFELTFSDGFSNPGETVEEVDADRKAVEFDVGAYSKTNNAPLSPITGRAIDITIDVSGDIAQKLADGDMGLFAQNENTQGWEEVPVSVRYRNNQAQSITFTVDQLATFAIQTPDSQIYLPIVK